jgi:hypothetical protein
MQEVTRIRALCCECGNVRSAAENYRGPRDANRSDETSDREQRGWRCTLTLKCSVCGTKTRHALLRSDDDEHRDFAELQEDERHAAIRRDVAKTATEPGDRLIEYTPRYRILECRRSAEAIKHGRHPGVSRELAVLGDSGEWIAIAFEYDNHWLIDMEDHARRIAQVRPFGLLRSCYVHSEDEAMDWLRFFGTLTSKAAMEGESRE